MSDRGQHVPSPRQRLREDASARPSPSARHKSPVFGQEKEAQLLLITFLPQKLRFLTQISANEALGFAIIPVILLALRKTL